MVNTEEDGEIYRLAQQIRLFYSPTVFDHWYPHFTLLNPYTAGEETVMASRLGQLFELYGQLTLESVCLLSHRIEVLNEPA